AARRRRFATSRHPGRQPAGCGRLATAAARPGGRSATCRAVTAPFRRDAEPVAGARQPRGAAQRPAPHARATPASRPAPRAFLPASQSAPRVARPAPDPGRRLAPTGEALPSTAVPATPGPAPATPPAGEPGWLLRG